MGERDSRTEMLLGKEAMDRLRQARVAVFGVGGVGSYAAEALARAGIGQIDLIDKDVVEESNINRQLCALYSTVGRSKAEVMAERLRDINPGLKVRGIELFYLPETADRIPLEQYDYIADAVDNVTAKVDLAERAWRLSIPMISCMGAGNKLDAAAFEVADLFETSVCPLAKVMRRELKRRGVDALKVVYSKEEPIRPAGQGRFAPASVSFVPSVAGLILAGEMIKDLAGLPEREGTR